MLHPMTIVTTPAFRDLYSVAPGSMLVFPLAVSATSSLVLDVIQRSSAPDHTLRAWISRDPGGVSVSSSVQTTFWHPNRTPTEKIVLTGPQSEYAGRWPTIPLASGGYYLNVLNLVNNPNAFVFKTSDGFFDDTLITQKPVLSNAVVVANGAVYYSSSVPHYGDTPAQIIASFTIDNITTDIPQPLTITATNRILSPRTYRLTQLTDPTYLSTRRLSVSLPITVDGAVVANGAVSASARNRNGTSTLVVAPKVLVWRAVQGVSEDDVMIDMPSATGDARAMRIVSMNGDTPNQTFTATTTDWDPSAPLAAHEATVVVGVLGHDTNDYGSHLPPGPSLASGRDGAQYATFWFRRTPVSKFDIKIVSPTGIAGCWVKLVGLEATSSLNGWFRADQPYLGSGAPGAGPGGNGSNGVGFDEVVSLNTPIDRRATITFGTLSSSLATNNAIMVRFKLTDGQKITALSFLASVS